MQHDIDTDLLASATKLGPRIAEHTPTGERERRLSRPVLDALGEAGFFRLLTPRSLGGLEVDPLTCARVIEEVAGFDSAAGWALQAANSLDWWCARLPDEGAEEIHAESPDVVITSAFHPPMVATPAGGGYRVSGRTPLASNIHDADWVFVTAALTGGEVRGVFLRAEVATVVDTWDSLGMRGSDSCDVTVEDVFVPDTRTFPLVPDFEPGRHYQGPLYRFPGMGQAIFIVCPTPLAVARSAMTELRNLAAGKTPFGSATRLAERPVAQATLGRAEAILRAGRALFYDTLADAWERTRRGEASTLEQKAELALAGAHAVRCAVEAVDLVYGLAGTSAIYARSPLERHFRDVQTLRHHGFTSESRYQTYGQVALGIEPEFGLVAF
jgi:alkylation response protein AidB-like acyl-CoA dehydrogenase